MTIVRFWYLMPGYDNTMMMYNVVVIPPEIVVVYYKCYSDDG